MVKLALKLVGALAIARRPRLAGRKRLHLARLPGGADAEAVSDALDPLAIGAFGALFGAGLIVYATRRGQL